MRQIAQLLLMCDHHDIGISLSGSESVSGDGRRAEDSALSCGDEPRIFVYDSYPGGIGFSEPLYRMRDDLLVKTRDLIAGCPCEHGCPTCVGPIGDGARLAKVVALKILDLLIHRL